MNEAILKEMTELMKAIDTYYHPLEKAASDKNAQAFAQYKQLLHQKQQRIQELLTTNE